MNTHFKKSLILGIVAGMATIVAGSAFAQSYLDGSAKARGDYGQMPRVTRSYSQPMFSTPNVTRSYSYEPAPTMKTDKTDKAKSNDANAAPNAVAAPNAPSNTRSMRSYSYEPEMNISTGSNRSGSSTPLYALPKSDSRKFGGR